jgi:hypothetical protein
VLTIHKKEAIKANIMPSGSTEKAIGNFGKISKERYEIVPPDLNMPRIASILEKRDIEITTLVKSLKLGVFITAELKLASSGNNRKINKYVSLFCIFIITN